MPVEEGFAKAKSKYVGLSPLKVRKVVPLVKGKKVDEGLDILKFMPQAASKILAKVIKSALANAENVHNMDVDELGIKNIIVDQGPSLKRIRPRARGRASRILKRSSHITVVLAQGFK